MRATINRWDRNDRTIDRSRINDALVRRRRRRVINVASLLPSHLSQAWPTAPTHSTHSPPHLTSLTSQHELDPTQRKAEATDFPVFFFSSRIIPDRSRARRINAVTGDNKTIFYAAGGQLLLPTSSETMLTCARRIVRDDSASFAGSTYYCWVTKKILSFFLVYGWKKERKLFLFRWNKYYYMRVLLTKNVLRRKSFFSSSKFWDNFCTEFILSNEKEFSWLSNRIVLGSMEEVLSSLMICWWHVFVFF